MNFKSCFYEEINTRLFCLKINLSNCLYKFVAYRLIFEYKIFLIELLKNEIFDAKFSNIAILGLN